MEAIEHFSLLLRVHAGNEGITNRLDHAIAKTHQYCGGEQRRQVSRDKSGNDTGRMKNESYPHTFLHTEKINNRAADDHCERETPKCRHECIAYLFKRQANTGGAKDSFQPRADRKRHGGKHKCYAAGGE